MKLSIINSADFIAKYNSLVIEQITSIDLNNDMIHDFWFATLNSDSVGRRKMRLDASLTKNGKLETIELDITKCDADEVVAIYATTTSTIMTNKLKQYFETYYIAELQSANSYSVATKIEAINVTSAKRIASRMQYFYGTVLEISTNVNYDGFILDPICRKINGKWENCE